VHRRCTCAVARSRRAGPRSARDGSADPRSAQARAGTRGTYARREVRIAPTHDHTRPILYLSSPWLTGVSSAVRRARRAPSPPRTTPPAHTTTAIASARRCDAPELACSQITTLSSCAMAMRAEVGLAHHRDFELAIQEHLRVGKEGPRARCPPHAARTMRYAKKKKCDVESRPKSETCMKLSATARLAIAQSFPSAHAARTGTGAVGASGDPRPARHADGACGDRGGEESGAAAASAFPPMSAPGTGLTPAPTFAQLKRC
jgi:hypothetical protein